MLFRSPGGGPRFINVIAIEQMHAGHAKMAGLVAAGCGSNAYLGRIVIVVDDDIDITNNAEVNWALATRWDPKTQTDIIDGCWTGYIDPRSVRRFERRTGIDVVYTEDINDNNEWFAKNQSTLAQHRWIGRDSVVLDDWIADRKSTRLNSSHT